MTETTMPTQIESLADSVLDGMIAYVDKRCAPLRAKIAELEAELASRPLSEPVDVLGLAAKVKEAVMADLPVPQDGKDGEAGKDADPVDMGELAKLVAESVAAAMTGITPPKDGENGKDAAPVDMVELAGEVQKLVDESFAKIKAPEDGKPGKDGKDAEPVDKAAIGAMILEQVTEAVAALPPPVNGTDGQDGQDGENGQAGRDALHIDILPEIEPTKSYIRGTWAKHAGGLFRAFKNTAPRGDGPMDAAGWECMLEGIGGFEIEFDGERELVLHSWLSSGKATEKTLRLPVPIYRYQWKSGHPYEKDDMATYDGGVWFAVKDTSDVPGTSDAWRLSTKRGRDGKDGVIKHEQESGPVKLK